LVDEPKLGLDVALLRFMGTDSRQTDVLVGLSTMTGVRQVLELAGTFEVLAIVVFDGADARRSLKARIQEATGADPAWFDLESESWTPSLHTWAELARRTARGDDLRLPD